MKEKIFISYYEDDGQVDVEVYEWYGFAKEKGKQIEKLTKYAYPSRFHAKQYVDTLRDTYDVFQDNEEEEITYQEEVKNISIRKFEGTHQSYMIDSRELKEEVSNYLYRKFEHPITIKLLCYESELRIKIDKNENSERVMQNLGAYFGYNYNESFEIGQDVLVEMFEVSEVFAYWHPKELKIIISVPINQMVRSK